MNADGTGLRKLADGGVAGAWSPDGSRIVYTSGSQLHVMNADGSRKRALPVGNALEPDWR